MAKKSEGGFVDKVMNTLRDAIGFSGRNRKRKIDKALDESDPKKKQKTSMRKKRPRTLRA